MIHPFSSCLLRDFLCIPLIFCLTLRFMSYFIKFGFFNNFPEYVRFRLTLLNRRFVLLASLPLSVLYLCHQWSNLRRVCLHITFVSKVFIFPVYISHVLKSMSSFYYLSFYLLVVTCFGHLRLLFVNIEGP